MIRALFPAALCAALFSAALFPCAAALAAPPTAAETLRPGLWEMSSTLSSPDPQTQAALGQMQKHLADMSPDQRQSVQQMLRQNGVELDLGNNGALRTRICLTRAMIERGDFPVQQGQCTQQATQLSPTHVKVAFNCTRPAVSGEGDVVVDDPTHYHARVTAATGNGQNAEAAVTGTWVAAECGNVRPAPVPKSK